MRRVGILGGTFDPVHLGHLDAAGAALAALDLDGVVLLPSHIPPHRPQQPRASAFHRFAMVSMACLSRDRFSASDIELQASRTSYTIDTLQRLHAEGFRPEQLFFITGADAFAEIATWHEYPRVLDEANFIVVSRPNHDVSRLRDRLPDLAESMVGPTGAAAPRASVTAAGRTRLIFLIEAPTCDTSSTEIRRRLSAGESIEGLVPREVEAHIHKHSLYQAVPLHGQDRQAT
jgi:nicotinate-nucleotide adenylyltransferase